MNQVDALLLLLLVPFALRGYWRGFCREGFGLAGLAGGLLAAAVAGREVAEVLVARALVPPAAALPVACGVIFLATFVAAALAGRIAERLLRALLLGGLNRVGGMVLGAAKGAAVLAFALLLVDRTAPPARAAIEGSRMGRPLIQLAAGVLGHLRAGEHPGDRQEV